MIHQQHHSPLRFLFPGGLPRWKKAKVLVLESEASAFASGVLKSLLVVSLI